MNTAIHFIKEYLCELAFSGHNIVHSVPIFLPGSCSSFGFTSVAHHIVTKSEITIQTCGHARKESPVILILGMCNFRPMTFVPPKWVAGWGGRSKSLGSICLSRAAFLEGKLLRKLAHINAATTVVPQFHGVINGELDFHLTTWALDGRRKDKACNWKQVHGSENCLEFLWEHRDGWSHEHGSTASERNGEYKIECEYPISL